MTAGTKNRLITINKLSTGRDLGGAVKLSFEERCKVWAQRIQKSGAESGDSTTDRSDREPIATQLVDWIIWYRADVKRTDRIVFDSVEYEIVDIQEIGFRQETRLFSRSLRSP